jgi:hypothetical protein
MEGRESATTLNTGTIVYVFYNSIVNKSPYV